MAIELKVAFAPFLAIGVVLVDALKKEPKIGGLFEAVLAGIFLDVLKMA